VLSVKREIPAEQRFLTRKGERIGFFEEISTSELKKVGLNSTYLKLKHAKTCLKCANASDLSASYVLKVKNKTIKVLLDSGLIGDLLFMKKRVH
jgi:hypothetical protein